LQFAGSYRDLGSAIPSRKGDVPGVVIAMSGHSAIALDKEKVRCFFAALRLACDRRLLQDFDLR
jgi:hypothetical protein